MAGLNVQANTGKDEEEKKSEDTQASS